ncbi:hypothetical protein DESC_810144 [Desulfosarcina cetonica]|nr:hypothetical protein DESC_810144 [Desulfosarcina cetonica]
MTVEGADEHARVRWRDDPIRCRRHGTALPVADTAFEQLARRVQRRRIVQAFGQVDAHLADAPAATGAIGAESQIEVEKTENGRHAPGGRGPEKQAGILAGPGIEPRDQWVGDESFGDHAFGFTVDVLVRCGMGHQGVGTSVESVWDWRRI